MKWRPQLVALDIDGTLVDRQGQLPAEVKAAVGRVVETDTPLVLATGRCWAETKPVFEQLDLPAGYVVVGNGTTWLQNPPLQVRQVRTFEPSRVIEQVAKLAPNARIAVEDVDGSFRLNRLFPDGDLRGSLRLQTLQQLCATAVTRVIVRDPNADEHDFIKLAAQLGMHGVSYSVGWSAWLDIAPAGVSKAAALQEIAAELGVAAANVLAIGDGRNDVEMLTWAGRGVAMGDAPTEVKDAANAVAAKFCDGGTALELDRWFAFGTRRHENRRRELQAQRRSA